MNTNVLYVRSPHAFKGGILNYSDTIISILRHNISTRYLITDFSTVLEETGEKFHTPNCRLISKVIGNLASHGYFDKFQVIIADIGVMEAVEFFILYEIKRLKPNIPTVVTIHDAPATIVNLFPLFANYQKMLIVRALRKVVNKIFGRVVERRFFNQGHNLVTLSRRGRDALLKKLVSLGCNGVKVNYLPHANLIDTRDEINRSIVSRGKLHVGYLGFISPVKGIDLLLNSLVELQRTDPDLLCNLQLTIAGGTVRDCDKEYLSSLQRLVRKHGLEGQVSFSGYLQTEAIPDFIRSLDLMVLPYRESGSGAASGPLMWARALGIPVLASDARNFSEIINSGKDGLLFKTKSDGSGIRGQLKEYISNISLQEALKSGAVIARDENSWEETSHRFEILLKNVGGIASR